MTPFGREDARKRAEGCRNAVQTYEGALRERRDYESEAIRSEGVDAERILATRGHVEVMRRRVEFEQQMAEAYERIARGEEAF